MEWFTRMLSTALLLVFVNFAWADPVDINSADAGTLATALNGIGEAKARAIVAYRNQHGAFSSAGELARVKGIGPRIVELNQDTIQIGKPMTGDIGK